MKRVVAFALALAFWLLAAAPVRAEIDREVLVGLAASVLKIEVLRAQGGFSLGSGVVVAPDTVVTNCHVTRDALKINVLRGGARWLVESQLSEVEHDLCLLHVPGLRASAVTFGSADALMAGQPVTALGFTGGAELRNSPGLVLATHRFDGGHVIQSSTGFSSGASGGGLFDESLHLVGILTFRLRGGEAHYFSAPVEWLQTMLGRADAAGYHAVAPDRSQQLTFWQRPLPDQPWYQSGLALSGVNRLPEAQRAPGCALAIEQASPAMPGATRTASAGTLCAPGSPSQQTP